MKKKSTLFLVLSLLLMMMPLCAIGQTATANGDVNDDSVVNIADVTTLIDYLLYGDESVLNLENADCNRDGGVNIADVTTLIDYLLYGEWPASVESTCAEVIAGPVGKIYHVTGTVTRILNTKYGNWFLADETGEIYIYGTLDANGQPKNFLSLGIEEGDIVTVSGPKQVYNDQVELVDVTVLNIRKAPIKVNSIVPEAIPMEGGNVAVNLVCRTANGVSFALPDEAMDWLSIVSITGGAEPVVTFRASANPGGDRSATITFKTTDADGKEYTDQATIYQLGSIIDCTVNEFLEAPVSDVRYRITGVVAWKEVNGYTVQIRDWSNSVYVSCSDDNGDPMAGDLKLGDIVTFVGKRKDYMGSSQMSDIVIENIIPVTPVTVSEFLEKEEDPNTYYMLTGTITEIVNTTFGNLYLQDETGQVYIYGTYPGWGATGDNRKYLLETVGIGVGDQLSVIGVRGSYRETPQMSNGIYFSHSYNYGF